MGGLSPFLGLMLFLRMADSLCYSNEEQTTTDDLIMRMNEYPEDEEEAYVAARKKESLLGHFGSDVLISQVKGKQNVVTFRRTASAILHDFF